VADQSQFLSALQVSVLARTPKLTSNLCSSETEYPGILPKICRVFPFFRHHTFHVRGNYLLPTRIYLYNLIFRSCSIHTIISSETGLLKQNSVRIRSKQKLGLLSAFTGLDFINLQFFSPSSNTRNIRGFFLRFCNCLLNFNSLQLSILPRFLSKFHD
jgi:hypothetical protein